MVALNKTLSTAAKAATDAISKDMLKQSRYLLSDKSLALQRAATQVRRDFFQRTQILLTGFADLNLITPHRRRKSRGL